MNLEFEEREDGHYMRLITPGEVAENVEWVGPFPSQDEAVVFGGELINKYVSTYAEALLSQG